MRSGFAKLSLLVLMMLASAWITAISAQDAVPEATPTLEPTVRPTSAFDFNVQPTLPPFGTATALPSVSGVGGQAINGPVSIRSGPGLSYSRLGALAEGRWIDIVGYNGYDLNRSCSPDFEADLDMWVMVRYRERTGWMARCALDIRGEQSMAYMINNAPPQGASAPTGYPLTGTPRSGS